jgi:hypothetical protein
MSMTEAQIKAVIQKNCGRSYTDFNNEIRGWLNNRIKDDVTTPYNFWFMETSETKTTVAVTRTIALPSNYKDDMPDGIVYRDSSTNACTPLDVINEAEARRRWATDDTGEPEAIIIKETTAEIWPLPDDAYYIDFECYCHVTPFSDSVTNNFISNNYPNLYIFAGTAEGFRFLEEPEKANEWDGQFFKLLDRLVSYNIERQTGKITLTPRADVKTHAAYSRPWGE